MRRTLFFFIASALMVTSASGAAQSRGDRAASVLVLPIEFEFEQSVIEVVGTAEAKKSVTLFPAVSDRVTEVNFVPGQKVEKGAVLLRLDSRRQAVALERAKIQLVDAERNLQRLLESKSRGAVTQSQIDEATTTKNLAEVDVKQAQTELEDRIIRAPFDGVLGLSDVEVGDRISLQTPITTIDNREELFVNFSAPEGSLNELRTAPSVTLEPWSDRGASYSAKVTQIDSRVMEQDRTIRARALLSNFDDQFRPGMSFRVKLITQGERFVAVPEASLSWGVEGAYVWVEKNGKASKIPVQVRQRLRGRILVSGDLLESDTLIVEGIQRLREGQSVSSQPFLAV